MVYGACPRFFWIARVWLTLILTLVCAAPCMSMLVLHVCTMYSRGVLLVLWSMSAIIN